jgi:hypothetical protein
MVSLLVSVVAEAGSVSTPPGDEEAWRAAARQARVDLVPMDEADVVLTVSDGQIVFYSASFEELARQALPQERADFERILFLAASMADTYGSSQLEVPLPPPLPEPVPADTTLPTASVPKPRARAKPKATSRQRYAPPLPPVPTEPEPILPPLRQPSNPVGVPDEVAGMMEVSTDGVPRLRMRLDGGVTATMMMRPTIRVTPRLGVTLGLTMDGWLRVQGLLDFELPTSEVDPLLQSFAWAVDYGVGIGVGPEWDWSPEFLFQIGGTERTLDDGQNWSSLLWVGAHAGFLRRLPAGGSFGLVGGIRYDATTPTITSSISGLDVTWPRVSGEVGFTGRIGGPIGGSGKKTRGR